MYGQGKYSFSQFKKKTFIDRNDWIKTSQNYRSQRIKRHPKWSLLLLRREKLCGGNFLCPIYWCQSVAITVNLEPVSKIIHFQETGEGLCRVPDDMSKPFTSPVWNLSALAPNVIWAGAQSSNFHTLSISGVDIQLHS